MVSANMLEGHSSKNHHRPREKGAECECEAREAAWRAARGALSAPHRAAGSGSQLGPRSEDWCKRLRLAVAMGLQTSWDGCHGTVATLWYTQRRFNAEE